MSERLPADARCEQLDVVKGGLCGQPAVHEFFDDEFGFDVYTCQEHAPVEPDPKAPTAGQLDVFGGEVR